MKEFKLYVDNGDLGNPVLRTKQDDVIITLAGENAEQTFQEILDHAELEHNEHPGVYEKDSEEYIALMADETEPNVIDAESVSFCIGVDYDGT